MSVTSKRVNPRRKLGKDKRGTYGNHIKNVTYMPYGEKKNRMSAEMNPDHQLVTLLRRVVGRDSRIGHVPTQERWDCLIRSSQCFFRTSSGVGCACDHLLNLYPINTAMTTSRYAS